MTDHWTASRALDEIGAELSWDDERRLELALSFIEWKGLDDAFSTFLLESARTQAMRDPAAARALGSVLGAQKAAPKRARGRCAKCGKKTHACRNRLCDHCDACGHAEPRRSSP